MLTYSKVTTNELQPAVRIIHRLYVFSFQRRNLEWSEYSEPKRVERGVDCAL